MKLATQFFWLCTGLLTFACTPEEIENKPVSGLNQQYLDTGDDTDIHPDNEKDADE